MKDRFVYHSYFVRQYDHFKTLYKPIVANNSSFINGLLGRQLGRNSVFAVAQTLISIACLFIAYRILIIHVGIERLGMWSLLMASSAIIRLSDVSGGGALARFVARERAQSRPDQAVRFIHTVLLTALMLNGVLAIGFYFFADQFIAKFVEQEFVAEAISLVPFALGNIVLAAAAGVLFSGVDGTQRADQRAMIGAGAALLFLVMTAVLVPFLGVEGFALALIFQQMVMVAGAWLLLRRHITGLGWLPTHWNKEVFRETLGFGIKIQAASMASMLFEPLAKFILSYWGGLAALGLYEIASRLVIQMRSLIIAATQPLIAAFAAIEQDNRNGLKNLLEKAMKVVLWVAVGGAFSLILVAPAISWVLLEKQDQVFLFSVFALMVGWNINVLSAPFYYAALGRGIMKWNLWSHITNSITMLVLGVPLGAAYGTTGVICTIVIALIASTAVTMVGNTSALNVYGIWRGLGRSLTGAVILIAIASFVGATMSFYLS